MMSEPPAFTQILDVPSRFSASAIFSMIYAVSRSDTLRPLKTYYAIKAFSELYKLGDCVTSCVVGEDLYACSATDKNGNGAILITYYSDDDTAVDKQVEVCVDNFSQNGAKVECYRLNEGEDLTLLRTERCTAQNFSLYIDFKVHTTYLLKLVKV